MPAGHCTHSHLPMLLLHSDGHACQKHARHSKSLGDYRGLAVASRKALNVTLVVVCKSRNYACHYCLLMQHASRKRLATGCSRYDRGQKLASAQSASSFIGLIICPSNSLGQPLKPLQWFGYIEQATELEWLMDPLTAACTSLISGLARSLGCPVHTLPCYRLRLPVIMIAFLKHCLVAVETKPDIRSDPTCCPISRSA